MLSAGALLGRYEVLSPLGAGGMGEVYRARDTRLDREIALKVLPEEVSKDPERLSRFEREAKAVAALNHPNILTVHDVGTHDGVAYLVSELLEGKTLRGLASDGALSPRQVVPLALQAAKGLQAAHARAIVHRDLKPDNLFVTADGRVKILDFGLAKQLSGGTDGSGTTATGQTVPGQLAGTVGYMSPEQARGLPVDPRSDVFSFGVVLYELLAGRHPFRRDSVAATLTAILDDEPPPLASLSLGVAPAVSGIVRRCLAKERRERYPSGHELAVSLETVVDLPSAASAALEGAEERSPYPGLGSFTEKDAPVFYGREEEVEVLWTRLRARNLLAVIGPSGVGKTSFVRAGVVPARPDGWAAVVTTPGASPAVHLAHALAPELAGDPEAVQQLLRFDDPDVAVSTIRRWRQHHGEALVVLDQFEELFTLNPPEAQTAFAVLIGRLTAEADVHVVLSLRDDFLMRCQDHAPLRPVFETLTPLAALSGESLHRALVEPARKRGYGFEDDTLVDEMVQAVEGARAALPLLAFAAARLWEMRDREAKLLTRAAYEAIGGVSGALSQHAEATLEKVGVARTGLVRDLFRELVTAEGTRAARDRKELLSVFGGGETPPPGGERQRTWTRREASEVLDTLVDARLLTSYEVRADPGSPEGSGITRTGSEDGAVDPAPASSEAVGQRIEIIHESLLKAWPRLVLWQTQDEEGAQVRDQLRQAAQLWEKRGRPDDLLWTGTSYQEYALWRERYRGGLSATEDEFASAMQSNATRRRRRRRAGGMAALTLAAAVAVVMSVLWQRSDSARLAAEAEARRREAAQILSLGRLTLDEDPTAALAYAIASLERADSEPARLMAVEALWKGPPAFVLEDPVYTNGPPRWSPDGQWLALGGAQGVVAFDNEGRRNQVESRSGSAVGFSDDLTRFVTLVGADLHVWSIPELELLSTWTRTGVVAPLSRVVDRRLLLFVADEVAVEERKPPIVEELPLEGGATRRLGRWPWGAALQPGTGRVFSVEGGTVVSRPLDGLDDRPRILFGHPPERSRVRFLGHRVVTASVSQDVRVWSASGELERRLRRPAERYRISTDPTGRYIATAPEELGHVLLFDLAAPRGAAPAPLLTGLKDRLHGMALHPHGGMLVESHPSRALLWNLSVPRRIAIAEESVGSVAFAPDGQLVSSSFSGFVRLWPLWTERDAEPRVLRSPEARNHVGEDVDVSSDGRFATVVERGSGRVMVLPLDGSPGFVHEAFESTREELHGTVWRSTIGPGGRRVAFSIFDDEDESWEIRIVDLATEHVQKLHVDDVGDECSTVEILEPLWLPDGQLVSGGGGGGLRVWDLASGTSRELLACGEGPENVLGAVSDSDTVVLMAESPERVTSMRTLSLSTGRVTDLDVPGNLRQFAVDRAGKVLVTADRSGVIRVRPLAGGHPHLLFGPRDSELPSIAVSPDGRWIAARSDGAIHLWPMPDVTEPPLHTLSLEELLAELRSFTNLRVVADPGTTDGYKLEAGPLPGWKDLPTW